MTVDKKKILMRSLKTFMSCFCVCTHLCTPLCVHESAQCVQQLCTPLCVQKTNTKPLPPPKLRGKRGIIPEKENNWKAEKVPKGDGQETKKKTKGERTDKGNNCSDNKERRTKISGTSMVTQRTV